MSHFVGALAPVAATSVVAVVLSAVSFVYVTFTGSNWFMTPATVTHFNKRPARRPVKDTM